MNEHDDLFEQLRAADPHPGNEYVDKTVLDRVFSVIQERRGVMTDTRNPRRARRPRPMGSRASLAFMAGILIVIVAVGGVVFVLRGAQGRPVADTSVTSPTTAPLATEPAQDGSVPTSEPAVVQTTVTTIPETITRTLSDQAAFFSHVALTPDGLPVISSYVENDDGTGVARLFFCNDPACEEFTTEDLFSLDWPGSSTGLKLAPDGGVYVAFGDPFVPTEFHSVRYLDGEIEEVHDVVNGSDLPTTFDLEGNPVIWGTRGLNPSDIVIVSCGDPVCAESSVTVLTTARFVNGPWLGGAVNVTADGGIRAVYSTGEPVTAPDPEAGYDGADIYWTTYVASCDSPDCTGGVTRSEIEPASGVNLLPRYAALDATGNVVLWIPTQRDLTPGHLRDTRAEYSIFTITCNDISCSAPSTAIGPTYAVQSGTWPFGNVDAMPALKPIAAYAETIYDPEEYAAFVEAERQASEQGLDVGVEEPAPLGVNLQVARCSDAVCTSYETTTIATRGPSWFVAVDELQVAPDGTIYVLVGNDAHLSDPALELWVFPQGNLEAVAPIEGTAIIQW